MKLEDLEKGAAQYRLTQEEARQKNEKERAGLQVSLLEVSKLRTNQAREVLYNYQATDHLKVIKDEIWGEGQIMEKINPLHSNTIFVSSVGIELVANSFPIIIRDRVVSMFLEQKSINSTIGVAIYFNDEEGKSNKMAFYKKDQYFLTNENLELKAVLSSSSVDSLISSLTPKPQLEKISFTDINDETTGAMCKFLMYYIGDINHNNIALPKDLKSWSESIRSQIPQSIMVELDNGRRIGFDELQGWVDDMRHTPRLVRSIRSLKRTMSG